MKNRVIFVGTKFLYNEPLKEYALRKARQSVGEVEKVLYFKDNDKEFFLELEKELTEDANILLFASKQNFATIGKILCTVTQDNLVLKEDSLIPSKSEIFAKNSYIVHYNHATINAVLVDEMKTLPQILIQEERKSATVQLFGEDEQSAKLLLDTLSQTYEVKLEFVTLIEGWIEVHVSSKKHGNIAEFIQSAKQLLPKKLIPASNIMLYVVERLASLGKTITFAESCTGGLLSYFLTKNNGASKILEGSLVTYSNAIKNNWLAVDGEVLENYGAVSVQTVEQMSEGAMSVAKADYAIAISGIAGDTGGTPDKPVGTVYISVRTDETHIEEHLLFQGDRNYVQYQSVLYAIKMLLLSDVDTFF